MENPEIKELKYQLNKCAFICGEILGKIKILLDILDEDQTSLDDIQFILNQIFEHGLQGCSELFCEDKNCH